MSLSQSMLVFFFCMTPSRQAFLDSWRLWFLLQQHEPAMRACAFSCECGCVTAGDSTKGRRGLDLDLFSELGKGGCPTDKENRQSPEPVVI